MQTLTGRIMSKSNRIVKKDQEEIRRIIVDLLNIRKAGKNLLGTAYLDLLYADASILSDLLGNCNHRYGRD